MTGEKSREKTNLDNKNIRSRYFYTKEPKKHEKLNQWLQQKCKYPW